MYGPECEDKKMFPFHYIRRNDLMSISNPWSTGVRKLTVPNVFVNIDLLKLMARNYDATKRCILLPDGTVFIHFAAATIQEVFGLNSEAEVPLSFDDLE